MLKDVFLVGGVRTAIGRFGGGFADMPAPALGSAVTKAALERAGIDAIEIDEVIFGNVLSAGLGQNVARQIAMGAGLNSATTTTTINKVCGSGLKSVMLAAQAIQCGDAHVVIAGGTENMSRAPYVLNKARTGYRMGHGEITDTLIHDGLWDVYNNKPMGQYGDRCAEKYNLTRQDQDNFAISSYQKAITAAESGVFDDEIIGLEAPSGRATTTVDQDEELARFNEEKLRQLRPAFDKAGTVTAGNASSINDGAAAIVVLSEEKIKEHNITPQAKILGYATHAQAPEWFTLAPIGAMTSLMQKLSLSVNDVDAFEINEAFSAVPMAAMADLNISPDKLNVHGGAVALGHPIGASGTRTLVTLLNALKHQKGKIGINTLCIGGGEAVALAVELC